MPGSVAGAGATHRARPHPQSRAQNRISITSPFFQGVLIEGRAELAAEQRREAPRRSEVLEHRLPLAPVRGITGLRQERTPRRASVDFVASCRLRHDDGWLMNVVHNQVVDHFDASARCRRKAPSGVERNVGVEASIFRRRRAMRTYRRARTRVRLRSTNRTAITSTASPPKLRPARSPAGRRLRLC